jgi:flagellar biosynthesis/type III secretory pathway M-ring protein FliF/YscJ
MRRTLLACIATFVITAGLAAGAALWTWPHQPEGSVLVSEQDLQKVAELVYTLQQRLQQCATRQPLPGQCV